MGRSHGGITQGSGTLGHLGVVIAFARSRAFSLST
jgi:hypothetical protein